MDNGERPEQNGEKIRTRLLLPVQHSLHSTPTQAFDGIGTRIGQHTMNSDAREPAFTAWGLFKHKALWRIPHHILDRKLNTRKRLDRIQCHP